MNVTPPRPAKTLSLLSRTLGEGRGLGLVLVLLLVLVLDSSTSTNRRTRARPLPAGPPSGLGQRPGPDSPTGTVSVEEATPDCDIPPPLAFPARQRQEHLAGLGVDRWHAGGYRGRGVKIAVLDSGFRGYRAQLGKALPARVVGRSFRADGDLEARDSQHGILCGEVLHALAPDAELLLANWDADCPEQFLMAAQWARNQGARIISCSIIMPSWSDGEGGGPVDDKLSAIIGSGRQAGDLLFFASAGNTAHRHWSGPFRDNGDGYHAWEPGQTRNRLVPFGGEPVSVELYWQAGAGYELLVEEEPKQGDHVTRWQVAASLQRPGAAVVHFLPRPGRAYSVRVRLSEGKPAKFHLVALGGTLSCAVARGSIVCPADSPAVIAVGAVQGDGQRATYSSCGPNSPQPKPDFVARVPFPSLWRSRPFTGTSAAAPQAAGLAALLWSRNPDWTPADVRAALRQSARDLGPPGHDCETGYGLIRLPKPRP